MLPRVLSLAWRGCPHLLNPFLNQPRNSDRAVGDSFNTSGALSR